MIPATRIRLRNCGIGKMIPTVKLICSSFSSVIATLQACMKTSQCVKSPRHLSHTMSADGITLTTRVASCSTTHLSRRQQLRKFLSSESLVTGRWLTDTVTRSCLARAGLTSTRVTNTKRSAAVDWSCNSTNVKQMGHSSQPLRARGSAKFLHVCNN